MGVFTFEDKMTSPVAPATLYKALVTDADNIIPKALDSFKSVENVEGNGGPGTIKKITFVEDGETKFVLHKIESIDEANLGYSYSVVGGAALPDTVEKITFDSKLAAGPNGGSTGKLTIKYQTKGDAQPFWMSCCFVHLALILSSSTSQQCSGIRASGPETMIVLIWCAFCQCIRQ